MGYPMIRDAARTGLEEFVAAGTTPAGLEQYRIDRLCELRAVVESLRCEREHELLLDVRQEYERFTPA